MEDTFNYIDLIAIYAIYAISLNLLLGFAGQLSVAHAAFGAVGGYLAAYLAVRHGWDFWPALGAGIVGAGIVGGLTALPALFLDVRWLVLLTLALSTALIALIQAIPALGGQLGLTGVPPIDLFGMELIKPSEFAPLLIVLGLIVLAVCALLAHSAFGRVLRGVRDDEVATRGVGKNVFAYKVTVFSITAAMAGLAGTLFVFYNSAAQPGLFDLSQTLLIIAMVVIGGTANLTGSIVGAAILVLLEPFLQNAVDLSPTNASLARLAIYGLLIVVFMIARPQGLLPEGLTPAAAYRRLRGAGSDVTKPRQGASERPPAGMKDAVAFGDSEMVVEANGLAKRFGGIQAVDGLSFQLRRGQIAGLIGPNGAGKTTVFNLLTGAIPADTGTVVLNGETIDGWSANRITVSGMARSYQDVRVFRRMTALENVMLAIPDQAGERAYNAVFRPFASRRDERRVRERALEHLEFVGLADRAQTMCGSMPFGEQKLLALARLIATDAEVLLLDEPASGIDMERVDHMLDLISRLRDNGRSVCIVEHNLHVVERIADWVYFMEAGKVTAEGNMADLISQERLAEVYFGSA